MISMVLHKAGQGNHFKPGFPLALAFRQLLTQVGWALWGVYVAETGLCPLSLSWVILHYK